MSTIKKMSRQRYVLIVILFFHSVNTYMDRACISSAKNSIMADLGITDQMMGYIFGIFAIGYALFQIPSGWIADRFGPRAALTSVVSIWSIFTMLTGAAWNKMSMLVFRFLFGMGEAGAFPGATRAFYRWLPAKERGIAQGINFSGTRLGAALSLFLMPFLIDLIGWRWTFVVNGVIGVIWAVVWLSWFRDEPKDHPKVNAAELEYIEAGQKTTKLGAIKASFGQIFTSLNMFLTMFQYFAHNVTLFFSFTWLLPYLEEYWMVDARIYAPIPLILAATAQWISGGLVTWLYQKGYYVGSRRLPAIIGFALAALGLLAATQTGSLFVFITAFSIATFGIDMILAPSWTFCMDIGKEKTGAISASMNMVGNIGAAFSAIIFPVFRHQITIPFLAEEPGSANSFFVFAAVLNILSIGAWLIMNPNRKTNANVSPAVIRFRVIVFITILFLLTAFTVIYKHFFLN